MRNKPILYRIKYLAFTLVELLTVIAIMSILSALLLSAVLSVRGKTRGTACLSNHRQIALAWTLYAGDYNDTLVPNADTTLFLQHLGWVSGSVRLPAVETNRSLLVDPKYSLLAPYMTTPEVYKCPSDESKFARSVAMNCRLNPERFDATPGWVGGLGTNYVTFRKLSQIGRPSQILLVLDERSDSINDANFAIDMSNTGNASGEGDVEKYTIIDFPGDYHEGSMASSFTDGHVELHKWRDFVKITPLGSARPGRVSPPGEQDVLWLQEHCTYTK